MHKKRTNAPRSLLTSLLVAATLTFPDQGPCQGLINFFNTSATLVQTNMTGLA
jgi:hypothetical protein